MRTYVYTLTAEIEVQAPNIIAAERAVRKQGVGAVRGFGGYWGSVTMPSTRAHEPRVQVQVRVDKGSIKRLRVPTGGRSHD